MMQSPIDYSTIEHLIMIHYSKLILLKDVTNMLQRGILYILNPKKKKKKKKREVFYDLLHAKYNILFYSLFIYIRIKYNCRDKDPRS